MKKLLAYRGQIGGLKIMLDLFFSKNSIYNFKDLVKSCKKHIYLSKIDKQNPFNERPQNRKNVQKVDIIEILKSLLLLNQADSDKTDSCVEFKMSELTKVTFLFCFCPYTFELRIQNKILPFGFRISNCFAFRKCLQIHIDEII